MKRKETIGFRVRTLSVGIRRAVDAGKAKNVGEKFTGIHGWVIGFLYDNSDKDIYQRDIEKQFSVRRPTMTEILKLMEKNGLVERVRDEKDARLKKIKLTSLALEIHETHKRNIDSFEKSLREGISEDELDMFFAIMDKIEANVKKAESELSFGVSEE